MGKRGRQAGSRWRRDLIEDGDDLSFSITINVSESIYSYIEKRRKYFSTARSTEIRKILREKMKQDESQGIEY